MQEINKIGAAWVADSVEKLTDTVVRVKPSEFNEENRYLPESVTSMPGYLRFAINPYMREIVDCFDIDSPVREVSVKKGVQITYTTMLESGAFYYMAHVRSLPMMYVTADKELAAARIENNFLPMLNHSGFADIIRSSDIGNTRKTGKTKNHLQFEGGGYLMPFGARNADKMRAASICIMLKDEIDAWPDVVGKDGDPDKLTSARCKGYWERRKIFRGSTPLIKGKSKIERAYLRGDQRKYMVLCKRCGFQQALRWHTVSDEGVIGGFDWELDNGTLILESVCYRCQKCGEPHYEHDKERLFSPDHGAEWVPTARAAEPGIRSYHLPALYSPIGMTPWYACVADWLEAWDVERNHVRDIGVYQTFYNNILAEPFEVMGQKITKEAVSGHRRRAYRMGEVPNGYAIQHSGSRILVLTCQVDVHKDFLQTAVMGWTRDMRCYLIDYDRYDCEDCGGELSAEPWQRLRDIIEQRTYTADDGTEYRVSLTLVDAGYNNDVVVTFCADYSEGVYPIVGRDRPSKSNRITEFAEFKTQQGTLGFRVTVDHYKDRLAPVLRREWLEDSGTQPAYHFNAPIDVTTATLEELTKETREELIDTYGVVSYKWHRPSGARNELWDLLGYGHAAVEIRAWTICMQHFELERIDWARFWDFLEAHPEIAGRVDVEKLDNPIGG